MKIKLLSFLAGAAVLLVLPACSTIKNMFPDKEKDYQYTTEIPELNIPKDLEGNEVLAGAEVEAPSTSEEPPAPAEEAKPAPAAPANAMPEGVVVAPRQGFHGHAAGDATASTEAAAPEPSSTASAEELAATEEASPATKSRPEPATDDSPAIDMKTVTVVLTPFTSNSNHFLRLGLPLRKSWLVVGKALSRNSVEITQRNQDESLYTVQFDPDEKVVEDEGITDEIRFFFNGIQSNEKEFSLKLIENKDKTDIVVVDKDQQPLPDDVGYKLLVLLEKTIKNDLAK